MKKRSTFAVSALRFKRFTRKGYGVFRSLNTVVNTGVVAAAMLHFALPQTAQAQQALQSESINSAEIELEEVEVTASLSPIGMNQAAKIVTVVTASDIAAAPVSSIQDLLEYTVGVDVRQRGEGGTQSDISIRGGTFDQIAVLLNGVNLSNPQTGHYNFDLPINLSDIERIEIISGPSSRIFGASAFAGAINIITKTENNNHLTTNNYFGMHEALKLEAGVNMHKNNFTQRFSAGYLSSAGYTDNTDYKQLNINWQSTLRSEMGKFHFQAGYNDKGYGANSFYSAAYPNQYDHTRRLFLSAKGETKGKIRLSPQVYWTRHFDTYKLFRHNPADWYTGHNYHETEVFGMNLNASTDWAWGRTTFGAELRNEGVRSNVLGKPLENPRDVPFNKGEQYNKGDNRTHISYFMEHNMILNRFTLSLGVLAYYNTALNERMKFYPGIDASFQIADHIRLYANWNQALRMPTFTDLYYESKIIQGNPNLRPEKSEAFEAGLKYGNYFLQAHIAGFYRKGRNMIDWVKKNPEDIWESKNLTKVDNIGIETAICFLPRELTGSKSFIKKVEIGYSYIHQEKESEGYISNYALEYLKHKLTAQLVHDLWKNISVSWNFRWQDRMGGYTKYEALKPAYEVAYSPYCLVDVKVNWTRKNWNVYAEANNLFDTTYYDLGNIPQAGIWVKAGFQYTFSW